ncbi:MAG: hypothetical protein ABJA98_25625 [Acidobacteriota bacterium]
MPELVKIPLASVEYIARFDRPYVGLISDDRPKAFAAVIAAWLPFNLRLANCEVVTTGTLADHKAIFRLPDRGIGFQFSAEEYKFTKDGSSWSTLEEDAKVLLAAEGTLLEVTGAKVASCLVNLAMHLQLLDKRREELLAPFVPEPFKSLMAKRDVKTFGNHLRWADGDALLDFSQAFANGIFLRHAVQFDGKPPMVDIMAKVRSDQEMLFEILGVEEAPNA